MHELKWFIIGAVVMAVGDIIITVFLRARRRPMELTNLAIWKQNIEADAEKLFTMQSINQLDRLVKVLGHVSKSCAGVYGNTPPDRPALSIITFDVNNYTLKGDCMGVQIRFVVSTGAAYVEWHNGTRWLCVSFDLTHEIPSDKVNELIDLFTRKKQLASRSNS